MYMYIYNTWQRILMVIHTVSVLVKVHTGVCLQGHGDDLCVCESRGAVVAPPFQNRQNNNCAETERDEQCSFSY